ncbi:hypothetical protein ACHAQH_003630 [Verticillium albo-atrum]
MNSETAQDTYNLAKKGRYYLSNEHRDALHTFLETTPANTWRILQDRLGAIPGFSFDRDENDEIWDMSRIGVFICLFGFNAFGPNSTGEGPNQDVHAHRRICDLFEVYAGEKLTPHGQIADPDHKWEDVPWASDDCFPGGEVVLGVRLHMELQFGIGKQANGLPSHPDGWEWCRPDDLLFAINSLRTAHANWNEEYKCAMDGSIDGRDSYRETSAIVVMDEHLSTVRHVCDMSATC